MRIVSSSSVCTTTSKRRRLERPMVTRRSSSSEWSGSGMVIDSVSPKTVDASAKSTRWFLRFCRALRLSHSNLIGIQGLSRSIVSSSRANAMCEVRHGKRKMATSRISGRNRRCLDALVGLSFHIGYFSESFMNSTSRPTTFPEAVSWNTG